MLKYLEKGTIECRNVGKSYLLELNICRHHSNTHITTTLLSYPTLDYIKQTDVDIEFFNMDFSSLNHNDVILQNKVNELNTRIAANYNLLYNSFSPAAKIAHALAGT